MADLGVLIVDDDPVVARLMTGILRTEGYSTITHAATAAEALERSGTADLILLDHLLPDASGVDLLPRLQALPNRPTVLIVTAHGSESLAATALRQGADDYVRKDESLKTLLPQVVERARRRRALRDAFVAAEADLMRAERLAAIGEMTVTMHHELNNPLMTAMAEIELLLTGPDLAPPTRSGITTVREALDRMRTILRKAGSLQHPESIAYLENLPMIDVHRTSIGGPSCAYRGQASVFVVDPQLAQVVSLLLRHAGFTVGVLGSEHDLREAINADTGLLVVAASTLLNTPDLHLTDRRHLTVVVLASTAGEGAAASQSTDLVIQFPFDPATVVQDIVSVMRT